MKRQDILHQIPRMKIMNNETGFVVKNPNEVKDFAPK